MIIELEIYNSKCYKDQNNFAVVMVDDYFCLTSSSFHSSAVRRKFILIYNILIYDNRSFNVLMKI